MTIWQAIIAAGLLLALLGKPPARLWFAVAGNFIVTMILAENPVPVAIADLMTAAIILGVSTRANIVAGLFALMQPIYIAGFALGWPDATTYACIDLLAYVQLGVMGGVDRGMGRAYRFTHGWLYSLRRPILFRTAPPANLARNSEAHRGGLNGTE